MSARITSATGVPTPDLRKPAIMSSRVRMPCTLPRLSVIGNSCCDVHSNASAENDHFIFTLLAWVALWRPRELLLYDGIRDAKLLGKLEQQVIEKA